MSKQAATESRREITASRLRKFSADAFAPRMVGYALSLAWVFIVMISISLLVPEGDDAMRLGGLVGNGSIVALVLTLLAGALRSGPFEALRKNPLGLWAPAILSTIGALSIPLCGFDSGAQMAALATAAVATGLGSGLFNLYWGKVYASIGGPTTAAEASLAYLLAALPVPLMELLPLPAVLAVVAVLPVASTLLLAPELKKLDASGAQGGLPEDEDPSETVDAVRQAEPASGTSLEDGDEGNDGRSDAAQESQEGRWSLETLGLNRRMVLVKLIVGSLVFGAIVTLVRSMAGPDGGIFLSALGGMVLVASNLVGALVVLGVLFFSKRFDMAFTYRPVLVLMVMGCLLVPFLGTGTVLAYLLAMTGYETFKIMNWVILADLSYRFDVDSYRSFGLGLAAVNLGVLAGSLAGPYTFELANSSPSASMAISFAMVFAIIIVYTFTLTERDIAKITRERSRRPYPANQEDESLDQDSDGNMAEASLSFDDQVDLLAERYEITGRNLEVLQLLAHGRTAARIEQELYMSRGTVNTHMRRLYQKLGVHSRQELLDMIYAIEPDGQP